MAADSLPCPYPHPGPHSPQNCVPHPPAVKDADFWVREAFRLAERDGWEPFGSHVDQPGVDLAILEFDGDDAEGLPLWERRNAQSSLEVKLSPRGFKYLPEIYDEDGGEVSVNESSAAGGPHIWLNVTAPSSLNAPGIRGTEVSLHLTIESAQQLAEQIMFLVKNHYQSETQ